MLVLDDLQSADDESAEVIAFCVRRVGEEPVLLLLAARSGLHGDGLSATRMREGSGAGLLTILELSRLGDEEAAQLIESVLPDVIERGRRVDPPERGRSLLPDRVPDRPEVRSEPPARAPRGLAAAPRGADGRPVGARAGLEELLLEGLICPVGEMETFDFDHDRLRESSTGRPAR